MVRGRMVNPQSKDFCGLSWMINVSWLGAESKLLQDFGW
jgi:hypothetical protein